MQNQVIQFIAQQASIALTKAVQSKIHTSPSPSPRTESLEQALERIYGSSELGPTQVKTLSEGIAQAVVTEPADNIATACLGCCVGHFSTTVGLLNEIVRFKKEGITSNEVIDRISKSLEEQNSLERVDLAPEKIQNLIGWEKKLAQEALDQSRSLRHSLENVQTIEELEELAANTDKFYKNLSREWFKRKIKDGIKKSVADAKKPVKSKDT